MAKRLRKTTAEQYEELIGFVERHKSVLLTTKTTSGNVKKAHGLWKDFAKTVNSKGIGPVKTGEQWKKIYLEWKRNTKRKSRMIKQRIAGGEGYIVKPLSDLEERLLTLISKIHLGDDDIPETIGIDSSTALENAVPVVENVPSNAFDLQVKAELENEDLTEMTPDPINSEFIDLGIEENSAGSSSEPSTSNIPRKAPRTRNSRQTHFGRNPTSHSKRFSGYYVDSAAQAYKEAQHMKIKTAQESAAAMNNLSLSINKLAESLASYSKAAELQAEAYVVKAQTEMLNAKLNMYKHLERHVDGES